MSKPSIPRCDVCGRYRTATEIFYTIDTGSKRQRVLTLCPACFHDALRAKRSGEN